MPTTRPLALAFLLLTGACAATPGDRGAQEAPRTPLRGGVAEFRVTSYDGGDLKGRVLLGATVLVVSALGGRVAARLPIRVVRTDKPVVPPDGGAEEPKPPPSDAGAP
jgi:hypothetical protein